MKRNKTTAKHIRELIAEIVKSPKSSPYWLSQALAIRNLYMSPQTIYYYLELLNLRLVTRRVKLREVVLKKNNADQTNMGSEMCI